MRNILVSIDQSCEGVLRLLLIYTMCFLIFMPVPLGLGRFEINVIYFFLAIIGIIAFGVSISEMALILLVPFGFVIFITTAIAANTYGVDFDGFQATRTSLFIVLGFIVYSWGIRAYDLYHAIDRYKLFLIIPLYFQAVLAFVNPVYLNSPLGGTSEVVFNGARIYIYPYALLYMLLPIFIQKKQYGPAIASTLILAVTGSKQMYIYIPFVWIICALDLRNIARILPIGVLGIFGYILSDVLGVFDRFDEFVSQGGDPTRAQEIEAATAAWLETPFTTVFGTGLGTRYWTGWDGVLSVRDADEWLINSGFDVHNGFMGILLRGGVMGLFALCFFIYRLQYRLPIRINLAFSIATLLSLSSSAAFYTNDFVFYVIATLYAQYSYGIIASINSSNENEVKLDSAF